VTKTVAFGSSAPVASVERLESAIRTLVSERLALRELGAGRDELEENRRRLVRLQWRLARAQIKLHLPADPGIGTRVAA
jgi:hypothetical protein